MFGSIKNQPKVNVSTLEDLWILSKIYLKIPIKLINVIFVSYQIHIQLFLLHTTSERGARYKGRGRRTVHQFTATWAEGEWDHSYNVMSQGVNDISYWFSQYAPLSHIINNSVMNKYLNKVSENLHCWFGDQKSFKVTALYRWLIWNRENNREILLTPLVMNHYKEKEMFWIVIYGLMVCVSVTLNCSVLWIIFGHSSMRTVTNYFLAAMALTDLTMCLLNCLPNLFYIIEK